MLYLNQASERKPTRRVRWLALLSMVFAIGIVSCSAPVSPSAPFTATAPQPTSQPPLAPPENTQTPTTLAPAATVAPKLETPSASPTPTVQLAAPLLVQPPDRALFSSGLPVNFRWTWVRALAPGEYFQLQLAKLDDDLKDWACVTSDTFSLVRAPAGDGWYHWRVIVRRGKIDGQQCTAAQDLTAPSDTHTFEWRTTTTLTPSATNPPAPTAIQPPPPTPTKRPYP